MNAIQLLEMATMVFINQIQETRWDSNRKMKKKVDLLTAALAGQSYGPQRANSGRGRGNPQRW
jgi:hypothetical protein